MTNSQFGIADSPKFRAQPPPLGSSAENLRTGNPRRNHDDPIRASPSLHARDVSHLYPRRLTMENLPDHAPSIFSEQASYQASDSYPLSWNTTNSSAILSSLPENFSSCLKTVL